LDLETAKIPDETITSHIPGVDQLPLAQTVWDKHVFRVLMNAVELNLYELKLRDELPPDDDQDSIGGFKSSVKVKWDPFLFPGHRLIFDKLFSLCYWILAPFDSLLSGREKQVGNRPLRVLRIVSMISQGGVAKVCLQSLLPMNPQDVENHLLVFGEKRGTTPELKSRPHIRVISRKTQLWPGSFRFKLFRNIWKLMRIIRQTRADLIHIHEPQFAPVVRMAATLAGGVPVCLQLHNDYNIRSRSIRNEFLLLTRHALRRCRLIACSRTIHRAGEVWLHSTRYPIRLIEDGSDDIIETELQDELPVMLERAADGRLIVAMMSHLVPHKRIEDFVHGCRILLDEGYQIYTLLMAYGKISEGRKMRKQFNGQIGPEEGEFLYRVKNPQRLMQQIGIGVSTSILEGLGLNILEYQISGVPVVCTDLMPHREMVNHGENGFLFEGCNLADFLRCMRKLLKDGALRTQLGQTGYASANQRKWSNTVKNTVSFYHEVLNHK